MVYSTISARFYSTLTLVMALSCLWMVNKNSSLIQINENKYLKIYEQYFVNVYAELVVIQSLWNLTEDWTSVHETDCIG